LENLAAKSPPKSDLDEQCTKVSRFSPDLTAVTLDSSSDIFTPPEMSPIPTSQNTLLEPDFSDLDISIHQPNFPGKLI